MIEKLAELAKSMDMPKFDKPNIQHPKPINSRDLKLDYRPIHQEKIGYKKVDDIKIDKNEKEIYDNANLEKTEINGRECLQRKDIDYDKADVNGLTNKERMERGMSPIKDGKPIELHHIGQGMDSPLAELTPDEHRGKGNDTILHDKKVDSQIDRREFKKERENHWKARAAEL